MLVLRPAKLLLHISVLLLSFEVQLGHRTIEVYEKTFESSVEINEYGVVPENVFNVDDHPYIWALTFMKRNQPEMYFLCAATFIRTTSAITAAQCVNRSIIYPQAPDNVTFYLQHQYLSLVVHEIRYPNNYNELNTSDVEKLQLDLSLLIINGATYDDLLLEFGYLYQDIIPCGSLETPSGFQVLSVSWDEETWYLENVVSREVQCMGSPDFYYGFIFEDLVPFVVCASLAGNEAGGTTVAAGSPLIRNGRIYGIASYHSADETMPQFFFTFDQLTNPNRSFQTEE